MSHVWPQKPLTSIGKVIRGVSFDKGEVSDAAGDNLVPILRAGNIQDRLNTHSDLVWVPKQRVASEQLLQVGDVAIAMSSGSSSVVGKAAQLHAPWNGAVGAFCAVIRFGPEINPRFGAYWLRGPSFQAWRSSQCQGANIQNLRKSDLEAILVPVPQFPEQEHIVSILDAAEELRRLRDQADRRTADLIPALFHEMFGDPATNPKGWPTATLGELTYINAPMVDPRKPEYQALPHIGADRIEKETGKLLPAKTAEEDGLISGKFVYDTRYVLYSKIRPYLRKAALPEGSGLCSADVYPVQPKEKKMTREFLWSILLSDSFTGYTASLSTRVNMPKVNRKQLEAYPTMLPPLPLQKAYSARIAEIRALETTQAVSRRRLDDLFQSLLHRAFQGEL